MDKIRAWLRKKNIFGLLFAYGLIAAAVHTGIWSVIEPMGIPESIERIRPFASNRWLIHIALTWFIAAPLTVTVVWWLFRFEGGVHRQLYQMKLEMLREFRRRIESDLEDINVGVRNGSHTPKDYHERSVKEFNELRTKIRFFVEIARYCDSQCAALLDHILNQVLPCADAFSSSIQTTDTSSNTMTAIKSRVDELVKVINEAEQRCLDTMRRLGY